MALGFDKLVPCLSVTRRIPQRTARRCRLCGCATCQRNTKGNCNASQEELEYVDIRVMSCVLMKCMANYFAAAMNRLWNSANGYKELRRPARSKLKKCVRCNIACWARPSPGAQGSSFAVKVVRQSQQQHSPPSPSPSPLASREPLTGPPLGLDCTRDEFERVRLSELVTRCE